MIPKNWKTTLAGVAAILTSVLGLIQHIIDGTPLDMEQHITQITLGIGLMVAKDHNVTGS
jgi:hypothetical protein